MSTSQFAVYQLKRKPELRNFLYRTYEELAQEQIPVQVGNYEQVKKNIDQRQPHNYKGHAISTSDVLVLNDNGETIAYYVNKNSFVVVPDFMRIPSSSGGLTKNTAGYEISGKGGTWEGVDYILMEGKNFFLMEHEQHGKDVAYVVLDQNGKVLVDGTYNGFDDEVKQKIRDYLHPPAQDSPDKQKPKLENWQKYLENGEYLRSAEMTEEANYNMIDGLNNNAAPKKEKKRPKESVLAKLHQKEKEIARRSGKKAMQEIMGQDMERAKK